ncbi:flagellar basal body L-ring protein FlgH [Dissulfurirhabdus thermomarina]|uniref:Flagellar L-ring protein n=1 Tax=Dissulfurirhabdus thermomarina TaxID=1765737 RepID=A0A6N9TR83_DISTH|nr:flagellar basal body L-ring protein FlgH [Dissulfurirhabdus thermomarina]NDY42264.1 flagellar basal body L-ring protein FlgH [Dissulfurirhabdus thermomarina]NMX22769.1 flagellar basal body L-ring protein FlgH [Dissulfurirhabdus thermomarina]
MKIHKARLDMHVRYPGLLALAALLVLSAGCAGTANPVAPAALAPTRPPVYSAAPAHPAEGSLFTPDLSASLVADFRARRVGDVLTIEIEEDLKGAKNVKTQSDRKSSTDVGLTGFLGLKLDENVQPDLPGFDASKALGGSTESAFDGSGKTSRDASLTGTVSARVVQVLPDGNLMVQGARELRINNETQYLILTGVIRPKDIQPDNTVSSTRLADARIEYTGSGVLSDNQRPGWLARLVSALAPF